MSNTAEKKSWVLGFALGVLGLAVLTVGGWWMFREGSVGLEKINTERDTTLVIAGSGSAAEFLKAAGEEYQKDHSGIHFKFLPATNTGDGVKGAAEGLLDIGAVARPLSDREKQQYPQVQYVPLFRDALAFGVHPSVNVASISSRQARDVYSGKISDWSSLGGDAGAIVVLDREEEESSKMLLRERVLGKDLVVTGAAIELHSADVMHETIANTKNAIGHASVGVVTLKKLPIKLLAFDGAVPTQALVVSGAYPLVREYGVVIAAEPSAAVRDFIEYLSGEKGRAFLRHAGLVPFLGE